MVGFLIENISRQYPESLNHPYIYNMIATCDSRRSAREILMANF
jgi:hypothetical protein